MHSQFQSLLASLEQLNESAKIRPALPIDIVIINQTSTTLHQLMTKWSALKPKIQIATSELEFQFMAEQIDTLVERIKTSSTNTIEALREQMQEKSDNTPLHQQELIKEKDQHIAAGTKFHSTGKKTKQNTI